MSVSVVMPACLIGLTALDGAFAAVLANCLVTAVGMLSALSKSLKRLVINDESHACCPGLL